jgi:hypothetical protein
MNIKRPADLVAVNVYNGFGSLLYFFERSISIMTDISFATHDRGFPDAARVVSTSDSWTNWAGELSKKEI